MILKEQLTQNGAWLFRWRSYLPLVFIIVLIPAFREVHYPFNSHIYDLIWEMFCLTVSIFGIIIRGYTIGYTPKGTSGRNTKTQIADSLNTTGIYSITRNPLYLGNFFIILGISIFLRIWWVPVIYILIFWLYYERIIMAEESFLINKFGKEYVNYAQSTPVFIPNFKLWIKPPLTFSFRNVLKREYSGFFGAIFTFTALEFIEDYSVQGTLIFDWVWVTIFVFGLIVYLVLRILKKNTKILHVEGR